MDEENEPLETLRTNAAWLAHIHVADTGRMNPGTGRYDFDAFVANLKAAGYRGMISAECGVADPAAGMRHSLDFLRRTWREPHGVAA